MAASRVWRSFARQRRTTACKTLAKYLTGEVILDISELNNVKTVKTLAKINGEIAVITVVKIVVKDFFLELFCMKYVIPEIAEIPIIGANKSFIISKNLLPTLINDQWFPNNDLIKITTNQSINRIKAYLNLAFFESLATSLIVSNGFLNKPVT